MYYIFQKKIMVVVFNPLRKGRFDFICYFLPTPRVFELFVCQVSLFLFFWISNEPFLAEVLPQPCSF